MFALEEVEPRIAGVPLAATTTPNSTDLRTSHLKIAISQKRIFRDQVVDAATGRPVRAKPRKPIRARIDGIRYR